MQRAAVRIDWRGIAAMLAFILAAPAAIAQTPAAPTIAVAAIVLVEPAVTTAMPIEVGPAAALPRNCYLRIKGLPPQSTLSDGHYVSPGTWALPITGLGDLKITVPLAATGRAELQLALLAVDGTILAEARSTLAIAAGSIGTIATPQPPAPPVSQLPGRASIAPEPVLQQPPTPVVRAMPMQTARPDPSAAPAMKPDERERAIKLMTRGNSEFSSGDIAAARLLYQRAADSGLAEAAIALGMTYDPAELAKRGVKGLQGEPDMARKWYARAQELGAPEAAERIGRLPR